MWCLASLRLVKLEVSVVAAAAERKLESRPMPAFKEDGGMPVKRGDHHMAPLQLARILCCILSQVLSKRNFLIHIAEMSDARACNLCPFGHPFNMVLTFTVL